MRILAIDTSSAASACGVFSWDQGKESPITEGQIEAVNIIDHDRSGAEEMISAIDKTLKNIGLDIRDIDAYAVITGPGSFTGIRIGLTMAKTMAQFSGGKIAGLSSLEALAWGKDPEKALKVPVIDARSNRIFAACYEGKWEMDRLMEESLYFEEDFIQDLNKLVKERDCQEVIFFGRGIDRHPAILDKAEFKYKIDRGENNISPIPSLLRMAALKIEGGQEDSYLDLKANYLRKSQAELERDRKKNDGSKN